MNAHVTIARLAVRAADLRDAREANRIESFVRETPDATPFHLPQWLRAIERGCGQRAHCLVAERGGTLAGVLPLTEMRSTMFGRALVSTGFAVGGGVLAHDEASGDALAEAAWSLAERRGCPGVELRGGFMPEGWALHRETYAGFRRALTADAEQELLAVPRKQRAEIRKALGNGLSVEAGRGGRDRDAHYRVYSESVRNLGTPVFPRALFAAVLDEFGKDADVLTVRKDGAPLASVLSLYFGGAVMPYWGGGTAEARPTRANDMLYYALMNHARARGCDAFDFGRSKHGAGAFAFKKNWGFAPAPLTYATRTREGASPRETNPESPRYRMQIAAWKRLPLWLANRLGPPIARGLG